MESARRLPVGESPPGLLAAHAVQWQRLPGWVRIHRAGLALMGDDVGATMEHGRAALAVLVPDDNLGFSAATALLGLASWRQGDLATAESAYAETIRRFGVEGHVADILGCAVTLADLQLTMGRLRDAERTYRNALALAERQPAGPPRGTPDMHVGLCLLHLERGDVGAAREHLRVSHELGEHLGLPKHPHRWRIAEADIREAEETWSARSRCSMRPSGSTTSTSHPTYDPSPRCGPASGSGRAGPNRRSSGRRREESR